MAKSIIKVIGYETRYSQDNYYLTVVVKNNIITNLYCYNGEIVGDSLRPQQKRILEALKPQERKLLDTQVWQVTNNMSGLTTPDNIKESYNILDMLYYNNLLKGVEFTSFSNKKLLCTIYNSAGDIEVDVYFQTLKTNQYKYWLVDDVKGSFAIETKIPLSKKIIRDFVSYDYQNYDLKILDF